MIRYLIDSDCAIYAMVEADSPLIRRMTGCEPGEIAISAISFAEIAHGSYSGKPPTPQVLDAFIAAIPLLPFDEAAVRAYAACDLIEFAGKQLRRDIGWQARR